jgi:hypothetical protein
MKPVESLIVPDTFFNLFLNLNDADDCTEHAPSRLVRPCLDFSLSLVTLADTIVALMYFISSLKCKRVKLSLRLTS